MCMRHLQAIAPFTNLDDGRFAARPASGVRRWRSSLAEEHASEFAHISAPSLGFRRKTVTEATACQVRPDATSVAASVPWAVARWRISAWISHMSVPTTVVRGLAAVIVVLDSDGLVPSKVLI
jgi:hypothetical protein